MPASVSSINALTMRGKLSLFVLLSAAVLSNLFPIEIPLVFLYLPASIFSLLILVLFGPRWGAASAFFSSLMVPLSVGHPYAAIWYTCEVLFVIWHSRRSQPKNLILSTALYWLTLGAPLVLISFLLLGVNLEVGLLIATKNFLNGIANATIASLLLCFLPLHCWLKEEGAEPLTPLSMQLFSLMLGFLILPALIMLISHLSGSIGQMENRVDDDLNNKALALTGQLELLNTQRQNDQKNSRDQFIAQLEKQWIAKDSLQESWRLTLLNYNKVVFSTSKSLKPGTRFNAGKDADLVPLTGRALHRIPHASTLFMPLAARWRQSSYLLINDIPAVPGWRLVVEKPVKTLLSDLRWAAIRIFALITLLTYPALFLAMRISRRIAAPLCDLSQVTTDLPDRLKSSRVDIAWPQAGISEVDELISNVRGMTSSLEETFDEIKDSRQHLEERVQQRTKELETALEALGESEKRYYTLAESSPVGIFYVNAMGQCIYVNQRWCQMVGMNQQRAYESGWAQHIHPDDQYRVLEAWKEIITRGQRFQLEFRICHPELGTSWVFGLATAQSDSEGNIQTIIGTITDINDRVETEQRLRDNELHLNYLAHHDSLTGLPNRLLYKDRLEDTMLKAKQSGERIALLFLDLDRFKTINDSLGHDCGDRLLCIVADRLNNCCNKTETVSRLGGDEFMIVMEKVESISRVSIMAQKILDQIAKPTKLHHHPLYTTASIGVSVFPTDGQSGESLLKAADTAMYRAKELGGNNCQFYTADMNAHAHERLLLESSLRQALDKEQLRIHYQPQIDLTNGQLVGFEALLRWDHPEHGLLPPAAFIPLAEETGLIEPISEWVLHHACHQSCHWQLQGHPQVRMAVNISARQFRRWDLQDVVKRALEETGLDPKWLELELTESMIIGNTEGAIQIMENLKQMGPQLTIDDFGSGYSSLAYLKRFPISKLKIAQEFVKDVIVDQSDAAIAKAIIALAKSLNLQVIAEGIETAEQLAFLQQNGCDQGQGFLLGKPLPAAEISSKFSQRNNSYLSAATETTAYEF